MGKASPIVTSFNGGELSPLLYGRPDVAKYGAGCQLMSGFIPLTQGPAVTRPGFVFGAEVKDSATRTWLMRFVFSEDDAYVIEAGDHYLRFFANRGQVVSGASPYEIASPYAAADLTASDGTLALRYVGTGDEIFIVNGTSAPQLLARHAATDWTIGPLQCNPPPFGDTNTTTTTVQASSTTGSVTLVASAAVFRASDVGTYFYLQEADVLAIEQWEAGKSITLGALRRSSGSNYQALNAGTTGTVKPTHTEGAAYDGDGGVQWQYLDSGYGWVKITTVTDSTHASGTVVSTVPDGAVTTATTRWARQAWNDDDGWPTCVTFFRERLVFARDSKLWFSVAGDFLNFSYEIGGQVTLDAAFDRTLASDTVATIRWLSPGDVLLIGASGNEWSCAEANQQEAFGPTNGKAAPQSKYGSNRVAPALVGGETVFVQKSGRKARAMSFRFESDGFESPDVTVYAEHITKTGITGMAYQQEPWGVLWCTRADGLLIGLTLNREQNAMAWHRHPLQGGAVESIVCIPSPSGARDDLWAIVRYTINGTTRRYVAYLADEDTEDTDQVDWIYSDMAATYRGAPATTIAGLDYLEGQTVWVHVDGARHPDRTITGGAIELQLAGSVVTVGLPSPAYLQPMDLEGGSATGTAMGKTKRAHLVTVLLRRASGGIAGASMDALGELVYRTPDVPMGEAPPPFTGYAEIEWDGDYDLALPIIIGKDRPQPMTVLAIMPQYQVSEGR